MLRLNKALIFLILFEIIFGGGGRLLEPFHIPSIRYLLFFCALMILFLNIVSREIRITSYFLLMILLIFSFPLYGALIGAIRGSELGNIFFDIQPYLYLLILPFLCFQYDEINQFTVKTFIKLTRLFALIASFLYLLYIIMLKAGYINFQHFYDALSLTNEFFFRPSGAFFSKSFFFIAIGSIFFFCERKYFYFFISMTALFLTETRGVFLFSGIAVFFASFKINGAGKNLLLIIVAFLAGFALLAVVGDRGNDSDSVRINDIQYVLSSMSDIGSLFGEGFGSIIAGRSRIEVVPLELFYKTGVLGVILSLVPIIAMIYRDVFYKVSIVELQTACALLFAMGVSITNPFLYTPMGIVVLCMMLIVSGKRYLWNA